MKLLYDLTATQPNFDGKFHGGGKYAKKIFLSLIGIRSEELVILGVFDSTKHIDDDILSSAEFNKIELIDLSKYASIRAVADKYSITRFYSALPYNIPELDKFNCEVIGTIHGLREIETKIDFHSLQYFKKFTDKAKLLVKFLLNGYYLTKKVNQFDKLISTIKIITVSNHTKYSILAQYSNTRQQDIKVFYSPDVSNEEPIVPNGDFTERNYFLLISGNRWTKNNLRSAIALDELFSARSEIKNNVIITGINDKSLFLNHIKNKDRFIFYDYVDENFLSILYQNAFALIYLTLNEGFGYPPIEAMKYSRPVIASPFTSITEICGDAVLYSNPYSLIEIKNRILQLFNTEIYNRLQKEGLKRYNYIKSIQDKDLEDTLYYLTEVQDH